MDDYIKRKNVIRNMSKIEKGKVSILYSKFILKILTFIGFYGFSLQRMRNVFPHVNELKGELDKFDSTLREVNLKDKKIPQKEELENGNTRITMKRSHKEAMEFLLKNFDFENYQEFLNTYAIQYAFTQFDNYLFEVFSYILRQQPILLGNITLPVIHIIEKTNHEMVIEERINKILHDKFYEDYSEIIQGFARKKLNLNHDIKNDTINNLMESKLIRDIYIHGEGIVNQTFLKKTNRNDIKLGDKVFLSIDTINDILETIKEIASKIDLCLVKTYSNVINQEFNLVSFIKAKEELASLFSFDEVAEGVSKL